MFRKSRNIARSTKPLQQFEGTGIDPSNKARVLDKVPSDSAAVELVYRNILADYLKTQFTFW